MAELPRGTVTLLFTDIEGSTRLLQELGRERYVRALNDHRRLLREAFTRHGGVEVEMQGDSFFFAFAGASDAVRAAAEAQRAFAEHAWEAEPLRARIGIHTGEPVLNDDLYAGLDVHRAARVMSAGHGGQVLVSETTRALLADEFELRDLGWYRLKDLSAAQRLYQLGADEFPPLRTLNQTNLPVAASPLVGRQAELAELSALLTDGARLVTVTGPGGTGKTRLALQVAADLVESFADGVFWVPLASVEDPELVLPTVGQAIGAPGEIVDRLRGADALLLLDNAEHLLPAAPHLAELLGQAPKLRLLVTSRAPLRVSGEHEYSLDPLPFSDAAMLFVERARAVGSNITSDGTVEAICRRLDGLPLAIELAAARTRLLSPANLLQRLERALPLLTGGTRDAPERQRTLRATIEWSYNLLDESARRLYCRLSVFRGAFSLDAAEDVCDAEIETLSSLVELNLLKAIGDSRFLMLETIREYSEERLTRVDARTMRERHARYYVDRVALAKSPDRIAHDEQLVIDRANIAAAFEWLHAMNDERELTLALAIWQPWFDAGHWRETRTALQRAVVAAKEADWKSRAEALCALAWVLTADDDFDAGSEAAHEALDLAEARGDGDAIARALNTLSFVAIQRGDWEGSKKFVERALLLARETGDSVGVATYVSNLGWCALVGGDYVEAASRFEEGMTAMDARSRPSSIAHDLTGLGVATMRSGDVDRAIPHLRRGVGLIDEFELRAEAVMMMTAVAEAAVALGNCRDAAQLLGFADALSRDLTGRAAAKDAADTVFVEPARRAVQLALDAQTLAELWRAGEEMSLGQAIRAALQIVGSSDRLPAGSETSASNR